MKKESKRLLKSIFAASLVAALGFGMVPICRKPCGSTRFRHGAFPAHSTDF